MTGLFYNGDIITMNDENSSAQAVVVKDGKIVYVGSLCNAKIKYKDINTVDLGGKTLMPAFIDSHSHFSSMAMSQIQVNLEYCETQDDIESKIKDFISVNNVKSGEWIIAKGYDQNKLSVGRHPTKELLDKICKNNPVVLQHVSGHMGVLNSMAMKELGLTQSAADSFNGRVNFKDGYFEEEAFFEYIKKIPMPDTEKIIELYLKAQEIYASYGITTVQEGMTVKQSVQILKEFLKRELLKLDLVAYCDIKDAEYIYETFSKYSENYKDNFRLGGYKIFLDGSPQGRTAWMKTPYLGDENNYYGNSTMTDRDVYSAVKTAAETSRQILAHCNGDAACEQYINAVEAVSKKFHICELRPVMIHAQLIDIDDLDSVKRLKMIPSFFVAHVYHWGDVHIKNFGFERASKISPVKSALEKNIVFTFHQDSPVIAPNMFETVWCAVNRVTKDGVKLGDDEAIDVYDALKAVTINSAYQYAEEKTKGSISVGKNADLIILDKNPLKVPNEEIKNIKVLNTIKGGKLIYKSN